MKHRVQRSWLRWLCASLAVLGVVTLLAYPAIQKASTLVAGEPLKCWVISVTDTKVGVLLPEDGQRIEYLDPSGLHNVVRIRVSPENAVGDLVNHQAYQGGQFAIAPGQYYIITPGYRWWRTYLWEAHAVGGLSPPAGFCDRLVAASRNCR